MEKSIEEKVLTAIAAHTAKHRENVAMVKEFIATMKGRGLTTEHVVSLVQFVATEGN